MKKSFLVAVVLLATIFGIYLRVQNLTFLQGKYLVGADPYRYFRQTRFIVEDGKLPEIDRGRNFPEGVVLTYRTTLLPQMLASFYLLLHAIFRISPGILMSHREHRVHREMKRELSRYSPWESYLSRL